jgi:hypothetical protein
LLNPLIGSSLLDKSYLATAKRLGFILRFKANSIKLKLVIVYKSNLDFLARFNSVFDGNIFPSDTNKNLVDLRSSSLGSN